MDTIYITDRHQHTPDEAPKYLGRRHAASGPQLNSEFKNGDAVGQGENQASRISLRDAPRQFAVSRLRTMLNPLGADYRSLIALQGDARTKSSSNSGRVILHIQAYAFVTRQTCMEFFQQMMTQP